MFKKKPSQENLQAAWARSYLAVEGWVEEGLEEVDLVVDRVVEAGWAEEGREAASTGS